ncbi:hypothetical protein M2436_001319 [Streptomyces sp. HB372]|nr:hypothetical protein [Streptomyces sp. HB372]
MASAGIIGTKISEASSLRAVAARAVGPAPGEGVHDAVGGGRDAGHDDQAHLQAFVEGIHRRDGDHEGGGTVAVQRDDRGEHRRTDDDAHRVGPAELQDAPDDRVEQADVDHHAEVDDGEHQHGRGGREVADAFDDVVAELRSLSDGDTEQCGDQYQRRDRRHLLRHDQDQEGRDHGEAEDCQHGGYLTFILELPPVSAVRMTLGALSRR